MKVPIEKHEGLYLKFFVLKLDDPDAILSVMDFAYRKGNAKLIADLRKVLRTGE